MSEMVERVARAIDACCADGVSRDWQWWENEARAAIEAMREPTEKMLVDAGTMDGYEGIEGHADRDHIEWWDNMIDAALSMTTPQSAQGEG